MKYNKQTLFAIHPILLIGLLVMCLFLINQEVLAKINLQSDQCKTIYAVQHNGSNSQVLSYDFNEDKLRLSKSNQYIEELSLNLDNDILYATTSKNAQLYTFNNNTEDLSLIGNIGFDKVVGLDFDRDGYLWGWSTSGLLKISINTGIGTLVWPTVPNEIQLFQEYAPIFSKITDLTWDNNDNKLYVVANYFANTSLLGVYDGTNWQLSCSNLPKNIKGLDIRHDGRLVYSVDNNGQLSIQIYDIQNCQTVDSTGINTPYHEVTSLVLSEPCSNQSDDVMVIGSTTSSGNSSNSNIYTNLPQNPSFEEINLSKPIVNDTQLIYPNCDAQIASFLQKSQFLSGPYKDSGYLREVVSVRLNGDQCIVETIFATLSDVSEDGNVSLEDDDCIRLIDLEANLNEQLGNNQNYVNVDAKAAFDSKLCIDIQWKRRRIKQAVITAEGSLSLDAYIEFAFDNNESPELTAKFPLFKKTYRRKKIRIPYPPYVIYMGIAISLDAVVTTKAISESQGNINVHTQRKVKFGAEYQAGDWKPIHLSEAPENSIVPILKVKGETETKVALVPKITVKFYEKVSANLAIKPYIKSTIGIEPVPSLITDLGLSDIPTHQLKNFDVDLGLECSVSADLDLFIKDIELFNKTVCGPKDKISTLINVPEIPLFSLPTMDLQQLSYKVKKDGISTSPLTLRTLTLDFFKKNIPDGLRLRTIYKDGFNNQFDKNSFQWGYYNDSSQGSSLINCQQPFNNCYIGEQKENDILDIFPK